MERCKLFISYASEDRQDIANPLFEALKDKFDIWYDQFSLVMGDSLRKKIDEGLAKCDFGIVILSKSFFSKNWLQMELNALVSRESAGQRRILPVWHKITSEDVARFSPLLADRFAIQSSISLNEIVQEIEKAIKAERDQTIHEQGPRQTKVASILQETLSPSGTGVLPSRVLGRELPLTVVEVLKDIERIEANGQRPDRGSLIRAMLDRSPHINNDSIDDTLPLIIRLLIRHGLIDTNHDSGGYPYWNATNKGISVLRELLSDA